MTLRRLLLVAVPVLLSLHYSLSLVVPPHPNGNFTQNPQRSELFRQSHDFNFDVIDPNFSCHNLTVSECSRLDKHAQYERRNLQSVGDVKVLVILVRFTDHADRILPSLSDIQELFMGNTSSNLIPTGSIRDYLSQNSYGRFNLQADVYDWITTDNTEAFYANGNSGLELPALKLTHAVLSQLEAQGVDLSQYDSNGDGMIDYMVALHSGYPAENGGFDCTNSQAGDKQRIWSHAIAYSTSYAWQSTTSTLKSGPYMIGSALSGTCGSEMSRIGVPTHEFLHLFTVPDLYDTSGNWIGKGVGSYDIMGNPYGLTGDQALPSNVGPWTKIRLGWLEPTLIEEDGLYTADVSLSSPSSVYKISAGFPSPNEFLIIENRQPQSWDASFTGGGLVIWHIDNDALGQLKRGHPGQADWPMNNKHYQVAVLQADGRYDLENGNNQGDAEDFYVQGKEIGPAPIEDSPVTAAFHPSTNSYHFGRPMQTGISIYDVSASGDSMTFRVSGITPVTTDPPTMSPVDPPTLAPVLVTPSPTQSPTPLPTVSPTLPPTVSLTLQPTTAPPIAQPTFDTIPVPTQAPQTLDPTPLHTVSPSVSPTPVPTIVITPFPTVFPKIPPTPFPTTLSPVIPVPVTPFPTAPSTPIISGPPPRDSTPPAVVSTLAPSTASPTAAQTTETEATISPSASPISAPTAKPPTRNPLTLTNEPTVYRNPLYVGDLPAETSAASCRGGRGLVPILLSATITMIITYN